MNRKSLGSHPHPHIDIFCGLNLRQQSQSHTQDNARTLSLSQDFWQNQISINFSIKFSNKLTWFCPLFMKSADIQATRSQKEPPSTKCGSVWLTSYYCDRQKTFSSVCIPLIIISSQFVREVSPFIFAPCLWSQTLQNLSKHEQVPLCCCQQTLGIEKTKKLHAASSYEHILKLHTADMFIQSRNICSIFPLWSVQVWQRLHFKMEFSRLS